MTDPLSDVLETLELSSNVYFRAELAEPWSIRVPEQRGVIRFHVVSRGHCTVEVAGGDRLELVAGDLVLVPHGVEHVLSAGRAGPARPLQEVLDEAGFDGVGPLVVGEGDDPTVMVCGHFAFDGLDAHGFIESLPPLLHLASGDGAGYAWLEPLLAAAEAEVRLANSGWESIVARLSQIMVVVVLRAAIERGESELGALSALGDPQLARVLRAVHASPETAWKLDSLAERAGVSRSVLVRRFRAVCGMSPMRYLTRWRMSRARRLLARTNASAGEIAALVGYASESAFNRAFKERFDCPPAAYRRALRLRSAPCAVDAGVVPPAPRPTRSSTEVPVAHSVHAPREWRVPSVSDAVAPLP